MNSMMYILARVADLHQTPQGLVAELPGLSSQYARIQVSGKTGDISLVMTWNNETDDSVYDELAHAVIQNAEDAFMVQDLENGERALTLEIRNVDELYRVLSELG